MIKQGNDYFTLSEETAQLPSMQRYLRFSLPTTLIVLIAAACVIHWREWWLWLILAQVIAAAVCVEYLVRQMPEGMRESSQANCIRLDGTRSAFREKLENKALQHLRLQLFVIFLLVILPLDLLIWIARLEYVSLTGDADQIVIVRRMRSILTDPRFDWSLRHEYRVIAWILAFAWCLVGAVLIKKGYFNGLRQFKRSTKDRAKKHAIKDLIRLEKRPGADLPQNEPTKRTVDSR